MGKCISKDQQIKIREIDERSYIAISNEFDYYHYQEDSSQYEDDDYDYYEDGGQSESKKSSSSQAKKMHGPETKGTSISFGFKKKNYSTANKKQQIIKANSINNNNNSINREKEEQAQKATIISNLNVITAEQNNFIIAGDSNGNTNSELTTSSDEKEFVRTTSPAKLQPAKRDQLNAGKSNRFGFRQNVIRPTSGAITPKFNEFDNVNNNGIACRAKSATATQLRSNPHTSGAAVTTSAVRQNEINANSMRDSNRPTSVTTPTSASQNPNQSFVVSRYTLQSCSLPRPQYPVSVSVAPSHATFARNTTAYSSLNTSRPMHSVQSKLIDTKGAKHQANLTKRGGMMTRRDESLDSGIASHDSTSDSHHLQQRQQPQQQQQPTQPSSMESSVMRRSRRRFEMIPGPSRHKFEIRDLNDYNENAVIVPLSLPKLPTDRREIVTNGLIRSTNSYTTDNETDMSISECSRPTSFISTASEAESFEEEKHNIDTSSSEKSLKGAIAKENFKLNNSKNSSPASWRSNSNNGGESLAMNLCSSLSISSSEDDRKNQNNTHSCVGKVILKKKDIDCDEDELSSMTITADHSSYLDSMTSKISPSKDQKETVNDAFLRQQQHQQQQQLQQPKVMGSISRKELFIQVDEVKFAETVAATQNLALLDDETSPSESLVSSSNSESGDVPMKKIIESKQIDEIKEEEDLEDVTPELLDLVSPCSPTHGSNSLSFSDGGRDDFLIDDEIADQPALLISAKKQNTSPSHRSISMVLNITSDCTTTTPTLKDISINSHGSLKSLNKLHALKTIKSDQSSPAVNRKAIMERSGSLDTLSPCDSIASDDLMADFDLASSLDSIDRHERSVDDLRINSENELRHNSGSGGGVCDMKEYGAIFRPHQSVQRKHSSRENITSQLPARATRLLNRRLQNNNHTNNSSPINNGSESPRSLDSMHSRASARASLREHLKQRQQQNLHSQLLNSSTEDLLVDKSLRNSMLQDVSTFKKQLVQLRRILQEDEDKLMMSDTLNPFEINGQIFSHLNGSSSNGIACENEKEMSSDDKEKKDDEKNVVLTNEQLMLLEDQRQELADLRRQVVFLQSQIDDKDRLIRQQQSRMDELKMDNMRLMNEKPSAQDLNCNVTETANCATQTERLRPVSMGGLAGSQDYSSQEEPHKSQKKDDTKHQTIPTITIKPSPLRSKTQISSVYTKLSSIKPTSAASATIANKNSSIPTTSPSKPMKSTKIEHPKTTPLRMQSSANVMRNNDIKTPLRRSIPQLVKTANGTCKNSLKPQKQAATVSSLSMKAHRLDDSNGNSATSSLSTSSSNSSINDKQNNNNNHTENNGIGFLAQQLSEIYSRGLLE